MLREEDGAEGERDEQGGGKGCLEANRADVGHLSAVLPRHRQGRCLHGCCHLPAKSLRVMSLCVDIQYRCRYIYMHNT